MRKIFKNIRGWYVINGPVRFFIKGITGFSQRIFDFFSIHWPVHGIIAFALPNDEIVKMFSKGDDFISTRTYWNGFMGYEGPSVKLFYYLSKKSNVIFDIGANVGYFSLIAAAANKNAKIYSFEPIDFIFNRLEHNKTINGFKNIVAVKSIAGDSNSTVSFYAPDTNAISFAGSTKKGWAPNSTEIRVESVTINEYKRINRIPVIDLVKIDCEFHEVEVLNGMSEVLKESKPVIIMEVLFPEEQGHEHFDFDHHIEIERIMRKYGYCSYLITETGLIRMDKLEYNPEQRNYLFSPRFSDKSYLSYSDMETLIGKITAL